MRQDKLFTVLMAELGAAPVGDHDLDAKVAVVAGLYKLDRGRPGSLVELETGYSVMGWPNFTTNMEDAFTLIPKGWSWTISGIELDSTVYTADLWLPSQKTRGRQKERFRCEAASSPLAICMASSYARQA